MDTELISRITMGFGAATALVLILIICFYICKDMYESCSSCCTRQRNRVPVEDIIIQNIQAIEMIPPGYEENARVASALATRRRQRRRQNHRRDNMTSDNVNNNENVETDTQLDEEATEDSNIRASVNDNESSRTHNTRDDSGVTINSGEKINLKSDRKDEKGNKSNVGDDSGIKSGSGDDTVDKFDDTSVSIKYDTGSGSSAGGGYSSQSTITLD